jgi:hypothetical protein
MRFLQGQCLFEEREKCKPRLRLRVDNRRTVMPITSRPVPTIPNARGSAPVAGKEVASKAIEGEVVVVTAAAMQPGRGTTVPAAVVMHASTSVFGRVKAYAPWAMAHV